MKKDIKPQTSKGFVVAWITSVAMAFIAGCFHSIRMESGHVTEFLKGIISGNKDALTALLFVGFVAAIAAALISALTIVFIARPLYLAAKRHGVFSLPAYLFAGLIISLVVLGVLLLTQRYLNPLPPSDYMFEVVSILIAWPVVVMSFWIVARPGHHNGPPNQKRTGVVKRL